MTQTISATDTELQKPVNVMFQQTLLRNARPRAPYFAGTAPATLQENGGTATAKWRRIENLTPTTSALSELTGTASYGMGRTADTASFTDVTAAVSKFGQYYILNEEADIFNFNGQTAKLVETLAISAGRSLNQLQRNVAEDNATLIFANGSSDGAVNTTIALTDIRNAVNQLERNSAITFMPMTTGSENIGTAPIQMSFWAITHPDVAIDIAQLTTGFNGVQTYAGQTATVLGEFGSLNVAGHGVRFIASEDASIDTGSGGSGGSGVREQSNGSADLYTTVVYGQDALGSLGLGQSHTDGIYRSGEPQQTVQLIVKELGSGGTADPFNEVTTLAWKSWHAGAVLNGAWLRGIRSAASSL